MPVLQKALSDMFSHCDILNSLNPEEVIAIGAAKQVGGGGLSEGGGGAHHSPLQMQALTGLLRVWC